MHAKYGGACNGIAEQQQHSSFAYRNECTFLKPSGDDGNPINAPDIVESEKQNQMGVDYMQRCPGDLNWLSDDQHQIPTRERGGGGGGGGLGDGNIMIPPDIFLPSSSSGGRYMDSGGGGGSSGETNDMSVSPNTDGLSNRPTPNSSAASDHRQCATGPATASTSASGSGNTPFSASPMGSSRNLGTQAEMDAAAAVCSSFFPDSMSGGDFGGGGGGGGGRGGGGGGTGFTPGNEFTVSNGWVMASQTMTPVAEGVMRHLLDMPMDSMDLSGWDSNT